MAFLVLSLPPSLIFSVRLVIFSVLVLHLKNEFDNAFLLLPSMSYVLGIFYLVVTISSLHYLVCQCQIFLYCFLKFDNLEFLLIFKFCL